MSIIEKAMEKAQQERAELLSQNTLPTFTESEESSLQKIREEVTATPLQEVSSSQVDNTKEVVEAKHEVATEQVEQKANKAPIEINPVPQLIMANENALVEGGSYRILKEYIIALRKNNPEKSVFMVTSPMKGEGKTLVSCNLACALASEIDIDLLDPMCHNVLCIKNPPKGLSDCLLHNEPISDCIIQTGIGKLSLLCAGSFIDNPAELITSKRMQNFLLEVKHRYPDRIIILDSLPILPFAESRALSRMTDGVMLVVREDSTHKRHLESALQQLQDVPLLGMIYNAATTSGVDKEIYNLSSYAYGN